MSTKHSAGHMQIQHIQDTCWSRRLKDWLSHKLVVLPALWGRGKNACGDFPSMHSLNWSGAGWYGSIKYDNMHLLQYLCTLQYTSLPLPLCSPGTWPRTHLSVTVTWSGWQTTCAPTPSRPAVPAAPALAALQTNALDRSRARNSVALVGQWLSLAVSERLPLVSLSLSSSLPLRQGLMGGFFHMALIALFLPSPFLSAGSGFYLCIVPSTSYHIEWVIIPGKRFYLAYHLLRQFSCSSINISPDELGAKERGIVRCLSISPPYYHIVSLVSHSDRSGLRSLVETGIRARVSVCAQSFFALYPSQAFLPPFPSPLVPSSLSASQAQVSFTPPLLCIALARPRHPLSLHPVPTIVFMHCAMPSGKLHCWGFTLLYSLICLARPSEEGSPCVFFFFFPVFGLYPFFFLSFSLSPSFPHVTLP